jgi:hypothetical protein
MSSSRAAQRAFVEKWEDIREKRVAGFYIVEETREEAMVCIRALKTSTTDKVITIISRMGAFNVYNIKELLPQIQQWKDKGCVLLKTNIREIDCGELGKATLFTVQPPDLEDAPSMCPLAMAFGTWVSGFSYITHDKAVADLVWAALGRKE